MKKLAAAVIVGLLAVGSLAFEPWTLWTRSTVDEALPEVTSAPRVPVLNSQPSSAPTPSAPTPTASVKPVELTRGRFMSQEHGTTGRARVVELADGRRILRLEDFSTSNGPDLHVWLSDRTAGGSWFKYDEVERCSSASSRQPTATTTTRSRPALILQA